MAQTLVKFMLCHSLSGMPFSPSFFFDWKVPVFFKARLKVTLLGTPSITWLWQITVFSSADLEFPILCPHYLPLTLTQKVSSTVPGTLVSRQKLFVQWMYKIVNS